MCRARLDKGAPYTTYIHTRGSSSGGGSSSSSSSSNSYLWWFKSRRLLCAKWSGVVGLRLAARERRATVQSLPLLTHYSRRRRYAATAAPPCTVQWVGAARKSTYGKGATPSNSPFGASLLFVLSWLAAVHIDMNFKKSNENMFSIKLFLKFVFCIPVKWCLCQLKTNKFKNMSENMFALECVLCI